MGYFDWVDTKIKRFNWTDIRLIKLSVAGFVLMVAKVWKPLLSLDWSWYGIICVLAAIKPVSKLIQK